MLNTEAMESERVSVLALQEFIYFSHVVLVVVGAQHLLARSPLAPLSAARTFCAIATCEQGHPPFTLCRFAVKIWVKIR